MKNVVDIVGHLTQVNIQSLIDPHILDEAEIMSVVFWYIRNQKSMCLLFFYDHDLMHCKA